MGPGADIASVPGAHGADPDAGLRLGDASGLVEVARSASRAVEKEVLPLECKAIVERYYDGLIEAAAAAGRGARDE